MIHHDGDKNVILVLRDCTPADMAEIMRSLVGLIRHVDRDYRPHIDMFYMGILLDAMLPDERQIEMSITPYEPLAIAV